MDSGASFFAQAYKLDGDVIISYRGTDDISLFDTSSDPWTAWTTGAGFMSTQAEMAINFYKAVEGAFDPVHPHMILTGHSLGGGLAGLVGMLYGEEGTLFDNMPFEQAAVAAYVDSTDGLPGGNNSPLVPNTELRELIYGSVEPWLPSSSGLSAFSVEGEVMQYVRTFFGQILQPTEFDPGPNVDLPGVDSGIFGGGLHSMSLLVLLQYAYQTDDVGTDWKHASEYFLPILYDNDVAQAVGADEIAGKMKDDGDYAGILRTAIAYSVIDSGARPFGDVAVRALFNDANELGQVFSGANANSILSETLTGPQQPGEAGIISVGNHVKQALAEIAVQYAGDQAFQKSVDQSRYDGVFELYDGKLKAEVLANNSSNEWVKTFEEAEPEIIGLAHIANALHAKLEDDAYQDGGSYLKDTPNWRKFEPVAFSP